jgi:hypothetical protein
VRNDYFSFIIPKCKFVLLSNGEFWQTERDYLNFPNLIEGKELGIKFENNLKFNKHTTKVGGK